MTRWTPGVNVTKRGEKGIGQGKRRVTWRFLGRRKRSLGACARISKVRRWNMSLLHLHAAVSVCRTLSSLCLCLWRTVSPDTEFQVGSYCKHAILLSSSFCRFYQSRLSVVLFFLWRDSVFWVCGVFRTCDVFHQMGNLCSHYLFKSSALPLGT